VPFVVIKALWKGYAIYLI